RTDAKGATLEVEVPTGTRSLRVRAIVGADGSTSAVARSLRGGAALRADRIVALRAYFEGVRGPTDRADLYFSADSFPGYCWVFPSANDWANVGIGVVLDTLPPMPEHIRELLQTHLDHDAAIGRRLKGARLVGKVVGWPLATFNPNLPVATDRALLIGDAA